VDEGNDEECHFVSERMHEGCGLGGSLVRMTPQTRVVLVCREVIERFGALGKRGVGMRNGA
jgi:hypothetical protein